MPTCPECGDDNPKLGGTCPRCAESFYIADDAVERARRDPYLGTRIAEKFVVVDRISEGGMGTVYRGVQMPVEREVAIKVLRAELEEEPEVRNRFRREARAISTLTHPNIITLYDFGFDASEYPYMVMAYVPGPSLEDWGRRDDIDLERILRVLRQILSALDAAHQREIVHRDLKPENIIVLQNGPDPDFVKLLDFGIARMLNQRSTDRLTTEGEVYGTPHYMSPEQATGQTDIGPPADIYAVGILLYEMICGEPPFDAADPLAIMGQHRDASLPELTPRTGLTVPAPLRDLLRTATAKDPADRYATAGEMLEALESHEEAETSGIIEAARVREQMQARDHERPGVAETAPDEAEAGESPGTGAAASDERSSTAMADGGKRANSSNTGGEQEIGGGADDRGGRATGKTPREESIREVSPDQIADDTEKDSPGLDWGGFEEHAPAEKDRAGQRKGVYTGVLDYLRWFGTGLLRIAGATVVLLAAFMALGARFDDFNVWPRTLVGLAPVGAALFTTLMGAGVWWVRRFCRDGVLFGVIGFITAHVPDPPSMATTLADDPVWFLEGLDHLPYVDPAAEWLAWAAVGYAELVVGLFG